MVTLREQGFRQCEISRRLGWSEATVRKWLYRHEREGRPGLASVLGRPVRGALSGFAPSVVEAVRAWRYAHPGWGPKTLRAELEVDAHFAGQSLPDRSSIARFLKEERLARVYEHHHALPQPRSSPLKQPHEEWEMDARGHGYVSGVGVVTLIHLNDRLSRLRLLSYPCWLGEKRAQRHPTTADYQLVLRLAFTDWGLPDRLAVDHDSVFCDNTSQSPFPTRLHLWLLALGVQLVFNRKRRPTDQAITERSHQLWYAQVVQGQHFADWQDLCLQLRARRDFLNRCLPCASLQNRPPLLAYPLATRPRHVYRPEWEVDLLNLNHIYAYLARGRWFRKASNVGCVTLGDQHYCFGSSWAKSQVEITFDPSDCHLLFLAEDGKRCHRRPIKGITLEILLADLAAFVQLPVFQLALPFTWDQWRLLQLSETLGDTT
jgi:transposase